MYEERLAEVCEQRATPYDAEHDSAANSAFVDYFQRLTLQGGHMSFLPAEQRKLEAGLYSTSPSRCRAAIAYVGAPATDTAPSAPSGVSNIPDEQMHCGPV